ncbi:MAG: DedA family protein [Sulfurospirillaceae bacterium]|nr:DedA family protein [Sulfurospirillaceae bacterium]
MPYLSLFFTSFAAATLLPGGSEALFLYFLNEHYAPFWLLFFATLGNTLGSFTNYLLGKYALIFAQQQHYMQQKWIDKATLLFERYGFLALWFSWTPIIGDPLTLVAGIARYSWKKFIVIVACAKLIRYAFLYAGFLAITQ